MSIFQLHFQQIFSIMKKTAGGFLMFLDGLDELDQKIVQLLIKNARISYSELGEQVGISRVAVKMRVQALEKRGIIEEYTLSLIHI